MPVARDTQDPLFICLETLRPCRHRKSPQPSPGPMTGTTAGSLAEYRLAKYAEEIFTQGQRQASPQDVVWVTYTNTYQDAGLQLESVAAIHYTASLKSCSRKDIRQDCRLPLFGVIVQSSLLHGLATDQQHERRSKRSQDNTQLKKMRHDIAQVDCGFNIRTEPMTLVDPCLIGAPSSAQTKIHGGTTYSLAAKMDSGELLEAIRYLRGKHFKHDARVKSIVRHYGRRRTTMTFSCRPNLERSICKVE